LVLADVKARATLMGIVPKDRLGQLREVWRLWKRLPNERLENDWSDETFRSHEKAVLAQLAKLCSPEITEVISENLAGAGLCGIYVVTANGQEGVVGAGLAVVYRGVRRAADTITQYKERPLHEHVKACVAQVLQEAINEEGAALRSLKPRELLAKLLSVPWPRAILLIDHSSQRQQCELRKIIYHELGSKPILLRADETPTFGSNRTPKQRLHWLLWHLWGLEMVRPEVKCALGGVPRIFWVIEEKVWPTNKNGEPLALAVSKADA
jgi:hypothetical protein